MLLLRRSKKEETNLVVKNNAITFTEDAKPQALYLQI